MPVLAAGARRRTARTMQVTGSASDVMGLVHADGSNILTNITTTTKVDAAGGAHSALLVVLRRIGQGVATNTQCEHLPLTASAKRQLRP